MRAHVTRALLLGVAVCVALPAGTAEAQRRPSNQYALELMLNGSPTLLETISATTSTRNAEAFSGGEVLLLQSDVAFYVAAGDDTVTVSSETGLLVAAGRDYVLILKPNQTHIAVMPVSAGTAAVKVFQLE